MRIPKIREFMTPAPRTIGEDIPISTAKKYMHQANIRHLPVLKAGHLVGIISDRDIKVAESFQGAGEFLVNEVMTPDPYTVDENEGLDSVLLAMAEHKYGCVIVHQAGSEIVTGIFTDTDGLRFCGNLLREQVNKEAA